MSPKKINKNKTEIKKNSFVLTASEILYDTGNCQQSRIGHMNAMYLALFPS